MPIFNAMNILSIHFNLHYRNRTHKHHLVKRYYKEHRTAVASTHRKEPRKCSFCELNSVKNSWNRKRNWATIEFFHCWFHHWNGLFHIEVEVQWKLMIEPTSVRNAIHFRPIHCSTCKITIPCDTFTIQWKPREKYTIKSREHN